MLNSEFRRQVTMLVLGASLTAIPTVGLTCYQARQQRLQFLLDRRISALKDFSAAVSDDGLLMASVVELEAAVGHLARRPPNQRTRADWHRVDSLYGLVVDERYRWVSKINAQGTTLLTLFPPSESPADCDIRGRNLNFSEMAGAQRPNLKTEEETLEFIEGQVANFKKELAQIVDTTQKTIMCHAQHLAT